MSAQICPLFERENEEKINLIGAWLLHPVNLQLVPDSANFMLMKHIAPMLSSYIRNEACRQVSNKKINVGNGVVFQGGAFIMGSGHLAPNENGALPNTNYKYLLKNNDGVAILVREKLDYDFEDQTVLVQSARHENSKNITSSKPWYKFWT